MAEKLKSVAVWEPTHAWMKALCGEYGVSMGTTAHALRQAWEQVPPAQKAQFMGTNMPNLPPSQIQGVDAGSYMQQM